MPTVGIGRALRGVGDVAERVAGPDEPLDEGEQRRLAEVLRECEMLLVVERLVAEEQHAMAEQRAVDRPDVGVRWRAQVDARDDGAERAGERFDVNGGPSRYAVAGIACAQTI